MQLSRLSYPVPLLNIYHRRRNIIVPHHFLDVDNGRPAVESEIGRGVTETVQSDFGSWIIMRLDSRFEHIFINNLLQRPGGKRLRPARFRRKD